MVKRKFTFALNSRKCWSQPITSGNTVLCQFYVGSEVGNTNVSGNIVATFCPTVDLNCPPLSVKTSPGEFPIIHLLSLLRVFAPKTLCQDSSSLSIFDVSLKMARHQYCLKWNNHKNNISGVFDRLRNDERFVDVTLASSDQKSIKCHRILLSAGSG